MPAVIESDGDHVVAVGFLLEEVEQSIKAVTVVPGERNWLPASVPDPHCLTIPDLEQEPTLLARAEARGPQQEVIVPCAAGSPHLAVPFDLRVQ